MARSKKDQELSESLVARLKEVMKAAYKARRMGQKHLTLKLHQLSKLMTADADVTLDHLEGMSQYGLAKKVEEGIFEIDEVPLQWARYFYDGAEFLRDLNNVTSVAVTDGFDDVRRYLRLNSHLDPLYVVDLERVVRQLPPIFGLHAGVLEDEGLLVPFGDKLILRTDLRRFLEDHFPRPVEKLVFRVKQPCQHNPDEP